MYIHIYIYRYRYRYTTILAGFDVAIYLTLSTLPDVLKKYNPDLKGFSTGYGGPNSEQAWLNVAIAGAKAA